MFSLNQPVRNWNGLRVWVIGASSGIGAALAKQLLARGAKVILSARRADLLAAVAAGHPQACLIELDVLQETAWKAAWQNIQSEFGGIDAVIFCAAEYRPERSWEVDPRYALRMLHINLASVYSGLALIVPEMMNQRSGSIGLIASVAGYVGLPNASVYGPGKAAMINLAEILYSDLHPHGVNVFLINPGFVDTGLTQKNKFTMPALLTSDEAASAILRGMARGQFEIHFPRRFTAWLKLLQLLPYRVQFALLKGLA